MAGNVDGKGKSGPKGQTPESSVEGQAKEASRHTGDSQLYGPNAPKGSK